MSGAVSASNVLNDVFRVQNAAVQQHFIHVLTLNAWNESAVAEEIVSIDAVDLPNAMRIVNWLVAHGEPVSFATDTDVLADCMPKPGATMQDVLASELRLDQRLERVLLDAQRKLAGGSEWTALIDTPLAVRSDYQNWLKAEIEREDHRDKTDDRSTGTPACISELFAHLMILISQSMAHSFVHWHNNRVDLANDAWFISGAAMMHATALTNTCARAHIALAPGEAIGQGSVLFPQFRNRTVEAIEADLERARYCCSVAEGATLELGPTKLGEICQSIASYHEVLAQWQIGHPLPPIANPCVNFERVYSAYICADTELSTADGN